MRSTAPRSIGTRIATPSSGANAADIGRVALPGSPCCRGLHDLPDEPLRMCAGVARVGLEAPGDLVGHRQRARARAVELGQFPPPLVRAVASQACLPSWREQSKIVVSGDFRRRRLTAL